MSVLVPSFPTSTNHHHHPYFSNRNHSPSIKHMSLTNQLTSKLNENNNNNGDINNDHVPFGVVNSMKQRLLDKVNESLFLNNNSTFIRHSLSKYSSRISSNENLLQIKSSISPLKRTSRLSHSQENLLSNNTEQFQTYLQPKQDLIIVDTTTTSNDENNSIHRHSYSELHVDEVPKPGTVTTVKNMFERQIRLSRYDSEKLSNTLNPISSRVASQHRDLLSPNRSRSISPNDMALRQRRTAALPTSILPSTSTTLLLPVSTSYPDLVISHTPPPISSHIEINKIPNEQSHKDNSLNNNTDEISTIDTDHNRPNLLLPSTSSSDTADYQPLDFKSRLALFNRINTIERSNEQHSNISTNIKKPLNHLHSISTPPNFLTKPVVHHHLDKKDNSSDQIARSIINTAKAVTFFGGTKVNENTKSTSIISSSPSIIKDEQSSISTSIDLFRAPDIIGGNVKLNKSSIFSGMKKDARVQFIDNIDTFEYPSFNIVMDDLGNTDSDDDNDNTSSMKKNHIDQNINDQIDDVDDDELEQLALINAKFNSNNNRTEETLQPKGSLHTFRPTHLDQYELGSQHGPLTNFNSSDTFSNEKYFTNHSILKPEKSIFDMTNNIQWSSMSTTTDLLF